MTKSFVGARIRRLREERGLTQVALAQLLQMSTSYMNQLENNQRPLTVPVLLRLCSTLDVDVQYFSDEGEARLIAQLRDAFSVLPPELGVPTAELRALAADLPDVGRALVALHERYQEATDRAEALVSRIGNRDQSGYLGQSNEPYQEVRDYFYARRNHLPELEEAAEHIFDDAKLSIGDMAVGLRQRLDSKHGVRVVYREGDSATLPVPRRYDPKDKVLQLPQYLTPGQRAFQMATQLAFLEIKALLDDLVSKAPLSSDETRRLAKIGLANYFAGALLCPYMPFLEAAEELRYDIERLSQRFGVGYEPICHRLSTLQRPDALGVPFFFVRVDRAGNISKRQSATDFHFSRVGGTCPLWNVYEAFTRPGRILTQLAQMPEGRTYLWIARTVSSTHPGYAAPPKEFAIGLGCDVRYADKLVYSKGLDLSDPSAPTPIGAGCKICERENCAQRAFPPVGRRLAVNEESSQYSPYPFL